MHPTNKLYTLTEWKKFLAHIPPPSVTQAWEAILFWGQKEMEEQHTTLTENSTKSAFTTVPSPQAKSAGYTTGGLGFWAGGRWMKAPPKLAPAAPTMPVTHQGTAMTGHGTVMPHQQMADSARELLLTVPVIMSTPAILPY